MTADDVLTRGVDKVLPDKSTLAKLMQNKNIRVYLGIDPTGPKLHLGHTIPLRKLQEFADHGHEAILVFGTGTVLAGDPSQRKEARGQITQKEIEENVKDWKRQAQKVLNFDKIKIKFNGDWLLKLNLADILNIASNISSTQLFKREMFTERLSRGDTVWMHETLYPLLQGFDSVELDVDAEIGGTDQTFNMLIGRELQKKMKNREKFVIATPLISGTDGKPMSKTSGNCVWLDDSPNEIFGKIMSLADSQIGEYWENLTNLPKVDGKPMEIKKKLAQEIVKNFYSEDEAQKAKESFENTFQKGVAPEDIPTIEIGEGSVEVVDFLVENNLAPSKSEAKRLIKDNAVEVDNETVNESEFEFADNQVLRVGKKKFVRIKLS